MRQPWHLHQRDGVWFLREVNSDGGTHSVSFGDNKAAAEAELQRLEANGRCRECHDVLYDRWVPSVKARVLAEKLCHTCLHWTDYVCTKDDPTHLVVGGCHYAIAPDEPKGYRGFLGHGGAEFTIQFHDGRRVVSHNLWAQGRIPEWFRDRLPDTATFAQRGHRAIGPFAGYGGAGSADTECV